MRHLRLTLGLAASVCTFALAASPALAGEFIASNSGKVHGVEESEQLFKFGAFKIKCQKATANGLVTAGTSSTYATSIKFAKCLTSAHLGSHEFFLATTFQTPLAVEYHANHFVETGSEVVEEEGATVLAGGTAVIKVNLGRTSEFTKSECHIKWPEQTLPKRAINHPEEEFAEATYTNASRSHLVSKNFPTGIQNYLVFGNAFKGIKYEFEGEPCEEWGKEEGPEGGNGTYTGSFPQILGDGNFEYH